MAIYHCSISNVSRIGGSSSTATLSYIQGQKVKDERRGKTFYGFGRTERVEATGTILPEYAPKDFEDPSVLFNSIELFETANNARTAKKIEVALPRENDLEQHIDIVESYIKNQLTSKGYCASYAIHADKANRNPHAHILVANRRINQQTGTWEKTKQKMEYALDEQGERVPILDPSTGQQKTDKRNRKQWKRISVDQNPLDKREVLQELRQQWAVECNRHLDQEKQIDHRSHEDRGIELIPTIHEGYVARQMEQDGKVSERCQINRANQTQNQLKLEIAQFVEALSQRMQAMIQDIKRQWKRIMEQKQSIEKRERKHQQAKQAQNERFELFSGVDELSPALGWEKAIQRSTERHVPKLTDKPKNHEPWERAHSLKELFDRVDMKKNQKIYLTDFGFEIKVGEYLNLERYNEPIQSYRIEKIDGDLVTWNNQEWNVEELGNLSRWYEVSKSEKKIESNQEKERHVDQGFEIE